MDLTLYTDVDEQVMEMQNGAAGANREATDRASCLAQVVVLECVPAGTRPEIVCSIPADK